MVSRWRSNKVKGGKLGLQASVSGQESKRALSDVSLDRWMRGCELEEVKLSPKTRTS